MKDRFLHCESQKVTNKEYESGSDAAKLVQHTHSYNNSGETTATKAKRNGKNSDNNLVGTIYLPSGEHSTHIYGIMKNDKGDGADVADTCPSSDDKDK